MTDAKGVLVASINHYPDFMNVEHPVWEKVMTIKQGATYLGNLYQDPKLDEYVFHLAVPIRNFEGKTFGVFHRIYAVKEFFSPSIEPIVFGETGHVMMIDSDGVVIDCPILPTGFQLPDPALVQAVTQQESNWAQTNSDGHGSEDVSIIGYALLNRTSVLTMDSSGKQWFTFAWQSSQELFAPTRKLFQWISIAALISIVMIVFMGSLASNRIVRPIRQLEATTARIGRGEKVESLSIRTGDEIESLADEINTMNRQLQEAFSGLEEEVRKKTKEIRYLQEYTESILVSVPDALIIFSRDMKIEYVNEAFENLANIPSEKVIGHSLDTIQTDHREQWKFMAEELLKYSQGEASNPILHTSTQKEAPHDPLAPQASPASHENRVTLTLGNQVYVYEFFDVEVKTEDKQPIGLLLRDISEEKVLQDQLTMAEKLSGLGTLAAGIAHEMNNPLFSIMGYTEAILDEDDPGKIKAFANKIFSRAKHMASVILNMSGYSRSQSTDENQDVDLNERLDASIEMALLASYSDDIELQKNYSDLPAIQAKPEEIQQIYLNIIRNGVQAMEGKGKLIISSSKVNSSIVTTIQDNGPGIPANYLSKVFDPFFTTKEQGKGSGLGLNIVHRLVEKYGGEIQVNSKVNEGTTFTITFPLPESE